MTINEAKKLLLAFYDEMFEADDEEQYMNNQERFKALDVITQDYAHKIIDKGQWT